MDGGETGPSLRCHSDASTASRRQPGEASAPSDPDFNLGRGSPPPEACWASTGGVGQRDPSHGTGLSEAESARLARVLRAGAVVD